MVYTGGIEFIRRRTCEELPVTEPKQKQIDQELLVKLETPRRRRAQSANLGESR